MDNKQTAVEWLIKELEEQKLIKLDKLSTILFNKNFATRYELIIEQAKEMEKQQIMDSYIMGSYDMAAKEFRPEQYYNETFKKEQND